MSWTWRRRGTRSLRACVVASTHGVATLACVVLWKALLTPQPGVPADAPRGLEWGTPIPFVNGYYVGLSRYTADEMNRLRTAPSPTPYQIRGGRLEAETFTYVPADVDSSGPLVVSVNVIDDYTWGAAALSDQSQRCYLILGRRDRADPSKGVTHYGRLPAGGPCRGTAARPETVTESRWPRD